MHVLDVNCSQSTCYEFGVLTHAYSRATRNFSW